MATTATRRSLCSRCQRQEDRIDRYDRESLIGGLRLSSDVFWHTSTDAGESIDARLAGYMVHTLAVAIDDAPQLLRGPWAVHNHDMHTDIAIVRWRIWKPGEDGYLEMLWRGVTVEHHLCCIERSKAPYVRELHALLRELEARPLRGAPATPMYEFSYETMVSVYWQMTDDDEDGRRPKDKELADRLYVSPSTVKRNVKKQRDNGYTWPPLTRS